MTDLEDLGPLPDVVTVTSAFSRRLPNQMVINELVKAEGIPFEKLATEQPIRVLAYRVLLREYPNRDHTSLWLHAMYVEIDTVEVDPTNGNSPTLSPPSAGIGAASP